jgi:uncharacterized protein YdhG (YjbR/CyaY superfamily)
MEIKPGTKFRDIEHYHSVFPEEVREKLEVLRNAIKQAAPKAMEVISYNMPAFRQHGVLVYYAAYKAHIGLYPTGSPIKAFTEELEGYKTSKGAIQLPLDKPIPKTLVKKIVKYRAEEDAFKAMAKAKKKK